MYDLKVESVCGCRAQVGRGGGCGSQDCGVLIIARSAGQGGLAGAQRSRCRLPLGLTGRMLLPSSTRVPLSPSQALRGRGRGRADASVRTRTSPAQPQPPAAAAAPVPAPAPRRAHQKSQPRSAPPEASEASSTSLASLNHGSRTAAMLDSIAFLPNSSRTCWVWGSRCRRSVWLESSSRRSTRHRCPHATPLTSGLPSCEGRRRGLGGG